MAEKTPKRKFPRKNLLILVILLAIQAGLVVLGLTYRAKPQDVIHNYEVTVTPQKDGSLDIVYHLNWEPLDASEPLTWIEIGMSNENYTVDPTILLQENVERYQQHSEDGYVALQIYFKEAYEVGEAFDISFTINQKDMLLKTADGYAYEFVPCWFNAIQVESYQFVWNMGNTDQAQIRRGSLDYGEYVILRAYYDNEAFRDCKTAGYIPFDDSGAYNQLESDQAGILVLCLLGALVLLFPEAFLVDSFISYGRGRGFMAGYGHPVHIRGRPNPRYNAARDEYMRANSGGRSGGGGCACACACACAGGGRAGCSQKDTFQTK